MSKLHRKNYNANLDYASSLFKVLALGTVYTCEAWGRPVKVLWVRVSWVRINCYRRRMWLIPHPQ